MRSETTTNSAQHVSDTSDLLVLSSEMFGAPLDVERTLSRLAELVVPRMADWAAVDIVDEANTFRRVGVAAVEPGGAELLIELHDRYPLRQNEGQLRGRVLSTLEPIALYDVDETELRSLARDEQHYEMLRRLGVHSAMWVPLIVRDRVVGVLSAGYRSGDRRYTPADLSLLRELARRAALALDNALLYRAVKRGETRQAAVARLGQQALAGMGYDDLAQSAAGLLAEILGVAFVEVLQLTADRRKLLLVAGVGWNDGLVGSATVKAGLGSQGGYTLATVGPVVLDDLATETRFSPPPLLVDHGVVSGLTVVIGSPAHPFGVLGAHTTEHRVFADDDVNFLQAMANVLAAAIERRGHEDRLNRLAVAEQARAAQLKAVIESIGDAVVVCDAIGAVVLSNPAADALLGTRLAEGLAGILRAFDWPKEQESTSMAPGEGIELRLAGGEGDGGQNRGEEADRWLEVSTFPVLADQTLGAGGGTILVLRDVTISRNARSVREAFLGVLSHELRTPVTTIYGGSQLLGRNLNDEHRADVVSDIQVESERLARLVEDLLVMTRVERGMVEISDEPVLLQHLLGPVAQSTAERVGNPEIRLDIGDRLPAVRGDATYVEQVVRNLLTNAVRYGRGLQSGVDVQATEEDDRVVVRVLDRGPGFQDDDPERLFDLFYRATSARSVPGGAGIGLFVCRHLIEAMGGQIWARPREGGGAEFGFYLPVMEADFSA
ncbi:MAG TPA: ATP-binding protein [Candidatus Limnocylindrales bacterium]|nr:ATP-binding protein [Candidatus Limnocylindrales bacterium]